MSKAYLLLLAPIIVAISIYLVNCGGKKLTGSTPLPEEGAAQQPTPPPPVHARPATCNQFTPISFQEARDADENRCPKEGTDPVNDKAVFDAVDAVKGNPTIVRDRTVIIKVGPYREAVIDQLKGMGYCAQIEPGGELAIRKGGNSNDDYNIITTSRAPFSKPQSHCNPAIVPFIEPNYPALHPPGSPGSGCGLPGSRTGAEEISCFREDPTYFNDLQAIVEEIIAEHEKTDADGRKYNEWFPGCPGGLCVDEGKVPAFYASLTAKLDAKQYCSWIPQDVLIGGEISLKHADGKNKFTDLFQVITSARFVRTHSANGVSTSSNETVIVLHPDMNKRLTSAQKSSARAWLEANETMEAKMNASEPRMSVESNHGSVKAASASSSSGEGAYRSTCWPADY